MDKKINKKIKVAIIGGVIISSSIVSFNLGGKIINRHSDTPYTYIQMMDKESQSKVLTEKAIIDEIKDNLQINILDAYIAQRVTIDGSNTDLSWFKNKKHIEYTGIAKFTIDLSTLNENAVKINDNIVTITMNKPMTNITIDQDTIEFEDEKGWLSFYDIKISPEQSYQLESLAKQNMKKELTEDNYYEEAMNKSKEKIQFLLNTLTENEYEVRINWL